MASLFAVSMAGPALAATASPVTTTVIPNGSTTYVPIAAPTAVGTTDIPAGTLTLSLPAGFSWAIGGAITTVETNPVGGTLAVSDGVITPGGTTALFSVTGSAIAGSTITFSSAPVMTTTSGASGNVVLSGLSSPSSVVVARLSTQSGPYGSAFPYYASATSVPADGSSTITLTLPAGGVVSTGNTVTITTSAGTFTASTGLTFTPPTYPVTSLSGITGITAGATITLQSATTVGNAVVTVQSGTATPDSVTTFHFTGAGNGKGNDQGKANANGKANAQAKGHGARKVAFYLSPAYTCPTGAQPIAHSATYGFAILNTTGHNRLNVNVVLKGAQPNATYDVWVNQDPGACPLSAPTKVGAIHTNRHGNGTANLHVAIVSGGTNFWVSATTEAVTTGPTSVLMTRAATLKIKR